MIKVFQACFRFLNILFLLSCSSCSPLGAPWTINQKQAQAIVWGLPEVQQWSAPIQNSERHNLKALTVIDLDASQDSLEDFWVIHFMQEEDGQQKRWETFHISKSDGSVFIVDELKGAVPIQAWRGRH